MVAISQAECDLVPHSVEVCPALREPAWRATRPCTIDFADLAFVQAVSIATAAGSDVCVGTDIPGPMDTTIPRGGGILALPTLRIMSGIARLQSR